jgi:phage I-like protein
MKPATFNLPPATVVALANATDPGEVLALENELALDNDGWALLAPFGEHRKARTVERNGGLATETFVQVFDAEAVDAILANEVGTGLFARLKRALIKRPIYNGHPDLKLYSPETVTLGNERLIPLGVNESCRKTARGLEFKPLLVPAGAEAIENEGCKYPSGLFLLKKTGVVRDNGDIEVRPYKLASIGLTPHPNISGVDSLANASANKPAASEEQQTKDNNMKQLLIGWLAAQGIALANDATDQTVLDAVQKHVSTQSGSLTALGNDKNTLTATVTSLTAARDAEKNRADAAALALANEQTALKAERKARCEAVVDLHIGAGRLSVADRDAKVGELTALANDKLDEAITALDKLPAKFAVTSQIGERKGQSNPSTGAVALANEIEILVKTGKTKSQALDEIIKSKPEIYRAYLKEGGGSL